MVADTVEATWHTESRGDLQERCARAEGDSVTNIHDRNQGPVLTEPITDFYLGTLIKVLEADTTNTASVSMTLTMSGGIVCGHLVSKDAWKALWAKQMQDATGSAAEAFRTFPDTIDSILDEARDEAGEEEPEDDGVRRFVHLKDATLFAPGQVRIRMPAWRGRMEAVSGWALGAPKFEDE